MPLHFSSLTVNPILLGEILKHFKVIFSYSCFLIFTHILKVCSCAGWYLDLQVINSQRHEWISKFKVDVGVYKYTSTKNKLERKRKSTPNMNQCNWKRNAVVIFIFQYTNPSPLLRSSSILFNIRSFIGLRIFFYGLL